MKRQNLRTVSLIVVTFTYLLIGAAIFGYLESEHEVRQKEYLELIELIVKRKYNISDEDFTVLSTTVIKSVPHKAGIQWKFPGAFYFATTVVTTIGYGHSTPATMAGRSFCMIYALIGIPLGLVMFQSIGERLNTFVGSALKYGKRCVKARNPEVTQTNLVMVVSVLSTILMTSMAAVFAKYERWDYFDALYYCFITLTTIGFGDYVALQKESALQSKPEYVALSLIFILFGLSVVSSAVNLLVLKFLTLNTEDERRDEQLRYTANLNSIQLEGDVITPSSKLAAQQQQQEEEEQDQEEEEEQFNKIDRRHRRSSNNNHYDGDDDDHDNDYNNVVVDDDIDCGMKKRSHRHSSSLMDRRQLDNISLASNVSNSAVVAIVATRSHISSSNSERSLPMPMPEVGEEMLDSRALVPYSKNNNNNNGYGIGGSASGCGVCGSGASLGLLNDGCDNLGLGRRTTRTKTCHIRRHTSRQRKRNNNYNNQSYYDQENDVVVVVDNNDEDDDDDEENDDDDVFEDEEQNVVVNNDNNIDDDDDEDDGVLMIPPSTFSEQQQQKQQPFKGTDENVKVDHGKYAPVHCCKCIDDNSQNILYNNDEDSLRVNYDQTLKSMSARNDHYHNYKNQQHHYHESGANNNITRKLKQHRLSSSNASQKSTSDKNPKQQQQKPNTELGISIVDRKLLQMTPRTPLKVFDINKEEEKYLHHHHQQHLEGAIVSTDVNSNNNCRACSDMTTNSHPLSQQQYTKNHDQKQSSSISINYVMPCNQNLIRHYCREQQQPPFRKCHHSLHGGYRFTLSSFQQAKPQQPLAHSLCSCSCLSDPNSCNNIASIPHQTTTTTSTNISMKDNTKVCLCTQCLLNTMTKNYVGRQEATQKRMPPPRRTFSYKMLKDPGDEDNRGGIANNNNNKNKLNNSNDDNSKLVCDNNLRATLAPTLIKTKSSASIRLYNNKKVQEQNENGPQLSYAGLSQVLKTTPKPLSLSSSSSSLIQQHHQQQQRLQQCEIKRQTSLRLDCQQKDDAKSPKRPKEISTNSSSTSLKQKPMLVCKCCCSHAECIQHALETSKARSSTSSNVTKKSKHHEEQRLLSPTVSVPDTQQTVDAERQEVRSRKNNSMKRKSASSSSGGSSSSSCITTKCNKNNNNNNELESSNNKNDTHDHRNTEIFSIEMSSAKLFDQDKLIDKRSSG